MHSSNESDDGLDFARGCFNLVILALLLATAAIVVGSWR